MRKPAVLLAVMIVLTLGQACQAADLQAGWYAKLGGVALFGWDGVQERGIDWHFVGGLGTFGPFEVTNPDPVWPERTVSVPDDALEVVPGTGVWLWGEPEVTVDFVVQAVSIFWDTDYDATQMRLELLMYNETEGFALLWSQTQSGYYGGAGNVLGEYQTIPMGYAPVFRVRAVPEPSSLMTVCGLLGAFLLRRRTSLL